MADFSNAFQMADGGNYVFSLTGEHNSDSNVYFDSDPEQTPYTVINIADNVQTDSIWVQDYVSGDDSMTAHVSAEDPHDLIISCTGSHSFNIVIEGYFNDDGTVAFNPIKTLFRGTDEENEDGPVDELDILYELPVTGYNASIGYKVDADFVDKTNESNHIYVDASHVGVTFKENNGNDTIDILGVSDTKINMESGVQDVYRSGKDVYIINETGTVKILDYAIKHSDAQIGEKNGDEYEYNTVDEYLNTQGTVEVSGTKKKDKLILDTDFGVVDAGKGDDTVTVNDVYKGTINAGDGNDKIIINEGYQNSIESGKGNDTIIVNSGYNNVILAGKGNDKIVLGKDAIDTNVAIMKGDGNLTIEYNKEETPDEGLFNLGFLGEHSEGYFGILPFGKSRWADISFEKVGEKDLKIIVTYEKTPKEKKAVVDTVTIKDAFVEKEENEYILSADARIQITDITGKMPASASIDDFIKNSGLTIKGAANKNNSIMGTIYNDTVYGGNKNDSIVIEAGNNTVYTGKKGKTFIGTGKGNDTFHVSNFKTNTIISDSNGDDTLYFSNKADDTYVFANFNNDGTVSSNDLLITNGKGLDSLNATKFYQRSSNGITLGDYYYKDESTDHTIENTYLNDNLSSLLSEKTLNTLKNAVSSYLTSKNYEGSALEFYNNKATKAEKKELINIYKSIKCGTLASDSYTIDKSDMQLMIASMGGGDKFTFKNKFRDTMIDATLPNTESEFVKMDEISIKNYAFDKGNMKIEMNSFKDGEEDDDPYVSNINIGAFDTDKKGKITDSHLIQYHQEFEGNAAGTASKFTLKDKTRTYSVENVILSPLSPIYDISNTNTNHITYLKNRGLSLMGSTNIILTNDKYNVIYSDSTQQGYFNVLGGHNELYSVQDECVDEYHVNMNKNSYTYIQDAGSGVNSDKLNITTNNTDDLRLFLNVSRDGVFRQGYDADSIFILDRSNLNSKNISVKTVIGDGYDEYGNIETYKDTFINKGIKIDNMFEIDENGEIIGEGTGMIENIYIGQSAASQYNIDLDSWVYAVHQDVASWLSTTNYTDTMAVFEKGNKNDINALLSVYNNLDYAHAQDLLGGLMP